MNRRVLLLAPFGATVVAGTGFLAMLWREQQGTFDPRGVPSMLIGKHVPPFRLPGEAPGEAGGESPGEADILSDADLAGRPILVNFFASWCVPCIEEAPVLMDLKRAGVAVYGIAYKDKPAATAAFLARRGNPYARIARDEAGRVAIDWGVTGVPESYLIDREGTVRWRYVGPLPAEVATGELQQQLRKYA
jgi:cytochrome c biogenesis protein CcmG, thiol:disulfide interchange protein DsbE